MKTLFIPLLKPQMPERVCPYKSNDFKVFGGGWGKISQEVILVQCNMPYQVYTIEKRVSNVGILYIRYMQRVT